MSLFQAQSETQKAAQEYQRSVEVYRVAKETLSLAEGKLLKADKRAFDAAWQEYVNHATMKVRDILACEPSCFYRTHRRSCRRNKIRPGANARMKKNPGFISNVNSNE
jgi:exonuclease VII small subunit